VKHEGARKESSRLWATLAEKSAAEDWNTLALRLTRYIELLLQSAHARKLLSHSQRNSEALWWHVYDSLQGTALIDPKSERNILDAGSGNGFPGVPMALALPELQFTLAERSGSKAEFLEFVLASLAIKNASVTKHELDPGSWSSLKPDLIVMRALVPASQLSLLFAKKDPATPPFIVFATEEKSREWETSARSFGYRLAERRPYILPETGARRETLKFSRT